MKPPFVPRALVAALAPPFDYHSVDGDLHEEYVALLRSAGRSRADRWYWQQVLRSIPAFVSYSRSPRSIWEYAYVSFSVVAVLVTMLLCTELLGRAVHALQPQAPHLFIFAADWFDAVAFGAILCAIARSHGVRLALVASIALVLAIAVPIALGLSSQLSAPVWALLLAAIPAMCLGAAAYQFSQRRIK